jgi:hypothetical protein
MKRTPLKKLGKKGLAWEKCRRELKVKFQRAGITTCEIGELYPGCWIDNGLGFAHARKRRNLKPGELSVVILACNSCHDNLELLPESEMAKIVLDIIARRSNPA